MAENSDIVNIKKSKILNAGDGLFAKIKINKGEFICWYTGVFIDRDVVANEYYDSDYLFTPRGNGLIIDAADPLSCFGRYANDSLSKRKTNAKFVSYSDINSAALIASKNITKNSEIYISYGDDYWLDERRYNILSNEDKIFITNYDNEEHI